MDVKDSQEPKRRRRNRGRAGQSVVPSGEAQAPKGRKAQSGKEAVAHTNDIQQGERSRVRGFAAGPVGCPLYAGGCRYRHE